MNIGPHTLPNPVILAPMAGVTDLPYRNLCREIGAGAAVAEMLTSNQELWQSRKSTRRQVCADEQGLRWIQILGNDPVAMASAALECEKRGVQVIDINMGCPAKKVCKRAAGSALLQDEVLVQQILSAVVNAVRIPVTLKIRTGYSRAHRNALAIAKMAEQSGIAALSVHGRTRECRYDDSAEYDTVAAVKQAISIPVIVNGDITSPQAAKHALDYTGADAVMVGRAALGNPWLFREIAAFLRDGTQLAPPTHHEIQQAMLSHVQALHQFHGDYLGPRIARKHVGWYEEQFPQRVALRAAFNQLESGEEQVEMLRNDPQRIM